MNKLFNIIPIIQGNKNHDISSRFKSIEMPEDQHRIKILKARQHQLEFIEKYLNEPFMIIDEPPGAGKTTTAKISISLLIKKYPNFKFIVTYPQHIIGENFKGSEKGYDYFENPFDKQCKLEWRANEIDGKDEQSKIKEIHNIIKDKVSNKSPLSKKVHLCTHMALSQTLKNNYEEYSNNPQYFNNIMFIIDEAHHLEYNEYNNINSVNELGKFIYFLFNLKEKININFKMWLFSGTYFRSNKSNILPKQIERNFQIQKIPFEQHWDENIFHIHTYAIDFVMYKKENPYDELEQLIIHTGKKKTIFCVPYYDCDKFEVVERIKGFICKHWGSDINIVDLVDENIDKRNKNKKYIKSCPDDIDVIISLKVFDEGADWKNAEQMIDLNPPKKSIGKLLQRFGRLWRDHEGKSHIHYYMFLRYGLKTFTDELASDVMKKSIIYLTSVMLLKDCYESDENKIIIKKNKTKKKNNDNNCDDITIDKLIKDYNERQEILEFIVLYLWNVFGKNSKAPSINKIKTIINYCLKIKFNYEKEEEIEIITKWILKILNRTTVNYGDLNIHLKDSFNDIWVNNLFNSMNRISTGLCDKETLKRFSDKIYEFKKIDQLINFDEEYNNWLDDLVDLINEHKINLKTITLINNKNRVSIKNPDVFNEYIKKTPAKIFNRFMEEYFIAKGVCS
jgi:superfamily II DNA or RNA helicase